MNRASKTHWVILGNTKQSALCLFGIPEEEEWQNKLEKKSEGITCKNSPNLIKGRKL